MTGIKQIFAVIGLGLVLLATPSSLGHAQTAKPRTQTKENAMASAAATQPSGGQAADKDAIRPFHVSIPEEALTELRRRIVATQWPEKETV
ncbi:MAG TPA: hypothetical protein VKK31_12560, partial [Thermoanaerobaculia bacterium]|nr:hypothetical protein [Thermoanaerobaculia bacterium]